MNEIYKFVKEKDHDKYKSYLHTNYLMWFDEEVFPSDRTSHDKWEAEWINTRNIKIYSILPLYIIIVNNTAVVHHLAKTSSPIYRDKLMRQSKWTEVFIKENNKWVLLTSHGQLKDE